MGDVNRIPIDSWQRRKNKLGKHSVPCIVTDRWIQFSEQSDPIRYGDSFWIDVMTDASGKPKKICGLAITKEDLVKALENVK